MPKLDDGFIDVGLDDGFEEQSLEGPSIGSRIQEGANAVGETLYDSAIQAAQGFSGGLADEASGAVGASLAKILPDSMGGDSSKDWTELYREYQKIGEKEAKDAMKRSPTAGTISNIAGSIGMGALLPIGKAAQGATKLPLLARMAGSVAKGAGVGGVTGGILGLTQSEGNLDTEDSRKKLLESGLEGAESGAKWGAGFGTLGALGMGAKAGAAALLKKVPDKDKAPALLRQMKYAFDVGKEGTDIANKEAFASKPGQAAEVMLNKINAADDMLGKAVGDSIANATAKGIKVNIGADLNKSAQELEKAFLNNPAIDADNTISKIFRKIYSQPNFEFTPDQVRSLRAELDDASKYLAANLNPESRAARENLQNLSRNIMSRLNDQVPEYAKAAKRFAEFREMIPETIIGKARPEGLSNVRYGQLKTGETKVYDELKNLINKSELPGTKALDSTELLNKLKQNFKQLESSEAVRKFEASKEGKQLETIFDRMGVDKNSFFKQIRDEADKAATVHTALGTDPHGNVFNNLISVASFGRVSTGRGIPIEAANLAGKAARALPNFNRALTTASDDNLMFIADKLQNTPGLGKVGEALRTALSDKNQMAKNAALFTILQNPAARQAVGEQLPTEE